MISIEGHELRREVRDVPAHSSSWKQDYTRRDPFIVCSCGWEAPIRRVEGGDGIEERIIALEHVVESLA